MELTSSDEKEIIKPTSVSLVKDESKLMEGKLILNSALENSRQNNPLKYRHQQLEQSFRDPLSNRVKFQSVYYANNVCFYLTDRGMYYGGESLSNHYPEKKFNDVMARRLLGIFAQQKVTRFPSSMPVIGVSMSSYHALAWTSAGQLLSWGTNVNGVLGLEDNEQKKDAIVHCPMPVKMGLGNNPGINFAVATNTASMVINVRGRIYYWGRLFEDSYLIMTSAERLLAMDHPKLKHAGSSGSIEDLMTEQNQIESSQPQFMKIVCRQKTIAVISKSREVYILPEPTFGGGKTPSLSLLPIQSKYSLIDIAITSRSMLVVYSTGESIALQQLTHQLANFEYAKCQALKASDYLSPSKTLSSDTRLVARKSSKRQGKSSRKKDRLPNLHRSSGMSDAEVSDLSKSTKKTMSKFFFPGPPMKEGTVGSFRNLGLSEKVVGKLKESVKLSSVIDRRRSREVRNRVNTLTEGFGSDTFPEARNVNLEQAPVLLSDYDYFVTPQLSMLAYSQGNQSRKVWMQLVASGRQNDLVNYTLEHTTDKPTYDEGKRKPRDWRLTKKLDDQALRQTVDVRGTDLMLGAREGAIECRSIQKHITEDKRRCQKALNLTEKLLGKKISNQKSRGNLQSSDIMQQNIELSKGYTSEFIKTQIEEKSKKLTDRIQIIVNQRIADKNNMPSYREKENEENKFKEMIRNRLKKIKFHKLIRPTLLSIQKTLVLFHFMRSISIFFDILSMQDDEAPLSVQKVNRTAIEDQMSKARLQRDSKFNFAMLSRYQHSSEIRLVINNIILASVKNRIEDWTDRVSRSVKILGAFCRRVARRRLLDLCILTARFNSFMVDKYASRIKDSNTLAILSIPETKRFLAKLTNLISNPVHLSFTLHEKHRRICIELIDATEDVSSCLLRLKDALVKEMMPFSIHWTALQFDRSYFLLKKTKLTEDLTKIDKQCKIEAISRLLDQRNKQLKIDIEQYWTEMNHFVRTNPKEISKKRTEYMLRQNYEHIERMIEASKSVPSKTKRTDNLPYQSRKREFMFAEVINSGRARATLNYTMTVDDVPDLLEHYNKLLKSAFLKYSAEQLKARRPLEKPKTENEIDQATELHPDD